MSSTSSSTPLVELTGDPTDLSRAVVRAVEATAGVQAVDLPPLGTAVDPDALNSVFGPATDGRVTFEYAGYVVAADADGTVAVYAGGEFPDP